MTGRMLLLGALWILPGCIEDDNFECSKDEECVSGNIAGLCQANNYCSFPDPACSSGQRYAEHAPAGFAEDCVPTTVAGGSTSQGPSSETASAEGGSDGAESDSDSGSGGASATSGDPTGDFDIDDSCVEVDLGSSLGSVDTRSFSQEDDDLSASCASDDGNDVVYLFTAPAAGEYRFRASGQLSPAIVSLWSSCGGSELRCGGNVFDPFSSSVVHTLQKGEPIVVVVDSDGEDDGQLQLDINLVI